MYNRFNQVNENLGCILDLGTLMHRLSSEEGLSSVRQGGWQVVSHVDCFALAPWEESLAQSCNLADCHNTS